MSDSTIAAQRDDHLFALDGMRGVAAVIVVLYHSSLIFPRGIDTFFGTSIRYPADGLSWMITLPVRIMLSGPQVVVLFFVLSGFVLARAMVGRHYGSYEQYAIKRFFRIWPVFGFVILVSALLSWLIGHHDIPGKSEWMHEIWIRGAKPSNIWRHLLMTETRVDLDNAMWSLIHELRISMIFPLIFSITVRHRIASGIGGILLILLASSISAHFSGNVIIQSYFETAGYIFLFVFGAVASIWMSSIPQRSIWGGYMPPLTFVLGLALLTSGPTDTAHVGTLINGLRLLICGLGATIIVVVVLKSSVHTLFVGKIARYLGRISYSLYLVHVVILAAMMNGMAGRLSLGTAALIALLLMIPAAELCCRYVEQPAMRAGRRIASALRHRESHSSPSATASLVL